MVRTVNNDTRSFTEHSDSRYNDIMASANQFVNRTRGTTRAADEARHNVSSYRRMIEARGVKLKRVVTDQRGNR